MLNMVIYIVSDHSDDHYTFCGSDAAVLFTDSLMVLFTSLCDFFLL